jgi:hypothetical protein
MTRRVREWTYGYASASEAGDYFQVVFEASKDGDRRYVLIQSQFEFPQNYDVKIETDSGEWYAELRVDHATLDRHRLRIDGTDDGEAVSVIVNHAAGNATYAELKRVLEIMLSDIVIQ